MKETKNELKNYIVIRNLIMFFDVFIALMIIFFASQIIKTELGKVSILFSLSVILLTTVLRILKRW